MSPTKPKHYCGAYPCPALIPAGQTYCDRHHKEMHKEYNRDRDSQDAYYGTARWKKLRNMKLKIQPLCEICLSNNITTLAVIIDHRIPRKEGGTDSLDNLQSLCRSCANKKTFGKEKGKL